MFFYSDEECQNQLYSTSEEGCYLETNDNASSYRIVRAISRRPSAETGEEE